LPYSYSVRTGDRVSVLRWSDFYTASQLRNEPYYCEYIVHPPPDRYCMIVPLPAGPGRTRQLSSIAPTVTSASGIGSPSNCCGRTCTRCISTPSAAARESHTRADGSGKFCSSCPRASATPTSPGSCSSRWPRWPSTWSTSSTAPGFTPAAPQPPWRFRESAAPPQHGRTPGDNRRRRTGTVRSRPPGQPGKCCELRLIGTSAPLAAPESRLSQTRRTVSVWPGWGRGSPAGWLSERLPTAGWCGSTLACVSPGTVTRSGSRGV
jgi:hypothetical protein